MAQKVPEYVTVRCPRGATRGCYAGAGAGRLVEPVLAKAGV